MRLFATAELTLSAEAPVPMIAMLRPQSGMAQWVVAERYRLDPFVKAVEYVDGFGNLCQRLLMPAGKLRIETEVEIEVADEIRVSAGSPPTFPENLPDYALQFLLPSRYCQADLLEDFARDIVQGKAAGYDQVEAIRAWIHSSIEYKYGVSDGSTSAMDTIRDKAGVCRDFSHVGMSLCRALRIPARMVVGYLHRLDPMDLHAWFEAYIDGHWFTFDATQHEPRGGRVAIAYGRDAADVALITELGDLRTDSLKVSVKSI